MFENTSGFKRIVVSGPQRSGTRIAAKCVCHDTGKIYIDEKDINNHDFRLLEWYLRHDGVVIQAPGLCHMLERISDESTLVIMVRRPIDEILASERRIQWSEEARLQELHKYGYSNGVIARIKYEYWDKVQKPALGERAAEIAYHTLVGHPLFVEHRESFRWDQTV